MQAEGQGAMDGNWAGQPCTRGDVAGLRLMSGMRIVFYENGQLPDLYLKRGDYACNSWPWIIGFKYHKASFMRHL